MNSRQQTRAASDHRPASVLAGPLLVGFLLLAGAALDSQAQDDASAAGARLQRGRVQREGATLRSERGFGGSVLASLPVGERLAYRAEARSEWLHVRLADGRTGWLHEFHVEAAGPGPAEPDSVLRPALPPSLSAAPAREESVVKAAEPERARSDGGSLGSSPSARSGSADLAEQLAQSRRREGLLSDELGALRRRLQAFEELLATSRELSRLEASEQASLELAAQASSHERSLAEREDAHQLELSRLEEAHRLELAAREEEARKALAAELARADAIGQKFIERCTALHETELERLTARLNAEREEALAALAIDHQKALAKATKESGWEEDFEAAVKEEVERRVKDEVDEAVFRAKTRLRGERDAHEREVDRLAGRHAEDCEAAKAAAVKAALSAREEEEARRISAALSGARSVCLRALESALSHGPGGVEPELLRELRESWAGDGALPDGEQR